MPPLLMAFRCTINTMTKWLTWHTSVNWQESLELCSKFDTCFPFSSRNVTLFAPLAGVSSDFPIVAIIHSVASFEEALLSCDECYSITLCIHMHTLLQCVSVLSIFVADVDFWPWVQTVWSMNSLLQVLRRQNHTCAQFKCRWQQNSYMGHLFILKYPIFFFLDHILLSKGSCFLPVLTLSISVHIHPLVPSLVS